MSRVEKVEKVRLGDHLDFRMAIRLAIRRQRASPAAAIPSMVQTGLSDIPPNTTRVAR